MLLSQKGNFKSKLHLQSEGSENNAILLESLNGGIDLKSQGESIFTIDSKDKINLRNNQSIAISHSGDSDGDNLKIEQLAVQNGEGIIPDVKLHLKSGGSSSQAILIE